ncbi:MAG TPA: GNAT family N-acetyltransferase [Streptosporangiales bacterium]
MTGGWTPQRVLDAAAAWVWVPPDAVDHDLEEYRLTYYPDRTSVQSSRSERPAAQLVDEVLAKVRADGRTSLRWWVSDATRPADTERELRASGFVLVETVDVLAWELGDAATPRLPRLDVPCDVTVHPVTDEAGVRLAAAVDADVFDWSPATEAQIGDRVRRVEEAVRTGHWPEFQYVACVGGLPAGAGGCTMAGDVARLWGAGVHEAYRGRGAYRALLDARMRRAHELGATLALVKGRVGTSGPILRRAGFTAYGQERCYQLDDVAGRAERR